MQGWINNILGWGYSSLCEICILLVRLRCFDVLTSETGCLRAKYCLTKLTLSVKHFGDYGGDSEHYRLFQEHMRKPGRLFDAMTSKGRHNMPCNRILLYFKVREGVGGELVTGGFLRSNLGLVQRKMKKTIDFWIGCGGSASAPCCLDKLALCFPSQFRRYMTRSRFLEGNLFIT